MAAAQAKQSLNPLLEFFLELFCRLSVQIVGENDELLRGFTPEPPVTVTLNILSTHRVL